MLGTDLPRAHKRPSVTTAIAITRGSSKTLELSMSAAEGIRKGDGGLSLRSGIRLEERLSPIEHRAESSIGASAHISKGLRRIQGAQPECDMRVDEDPAEVSTRRLAHQPVLNRKEVISARSRDEIGLEGAGHDSHKRVGQSWAARASVNEVSEPSADDRRESVVQCGDFAGADLRMLMNGHAAGTGGPDNSLHMEVARNLHARGGRGVPVQATHVSQLPAYIDKQRGRRRVLSQSRAAFQPCHVTEQAAYVDTRRGHKGYLRHRCRHPELLTGSGQY
jgi:hypothetical protein